MGGKQEETLPLFETKPARGKAAYKLFASTIFMGICMIWLYRLIYFPRAGEPGRWVWFGMFISELLFGLFWIITQPVRWNVVYRYPFKERLSSRYEDILPAVDIFVCTADPTLEPPILVINTVLSVMSYNYPPEKLSIYLSDDGGSELTFYSLLEATKFSKYWIPFCKKFNVEPRSPAAYFDQGCDLTDALFAKECSAVKKLYDDMKTRIETVTGKGTVPNDLRDQHKGFSEWSSKITKQDHQPIVQILVDGRNPGEVDTNRGRLPTVVYLAREKRPQFRHNFKAGSMNALIRVSSEISNAPIILNLDCDMYSNDADTIRDALCFFMDEKQGHDISYVQYPQRYNNITKNDLYSNAGRVIHEIELAGIGGYGAALYCGTGCFHRRESLSGRQFSKDQKPDWSYGHDKNKTRTVEEMEEASKHVASCSYEQDTLWGKEMGLIYGCPVEDIVTGLTIQCRGWKSIYYNPSRSAFVGIAPNTLDIALVQYKRWSEGLFQIVLSKYCPFIYGHGKIKLGAQMGYCIYLLWAPIAFPTLYYVIVPSLCLLHNVPLFPEASSLWFLPFAYVFSAKYVYSLLEALFSGDTVKSWWNSQRMWVIRRTTAYGLAFIDTVIRQLGFSQTAFAVTAKVVDDDVLKRYEQEIMDFGSSSIIFTIIPTLALINLLSLLWGIKALVLTTAVLRFIPQIIISGLMVAVNIPVYQALFFRDDGGRLPSAVMFRSIVIASVACLIPIFLL